MWSFLRRLSQWWLVAALALPPLSPAVNATAAPSSAAPFVEVTWQASTPQFEPQMDGSVAVSLAGFAQLAALGLPRVPVTSKLIALPLGAQPTVEIVETETAALAVPGEVAYTPRPIGVARSVGGLPEKSLFEAVPANERPAFNVNTVELEAAGVMRGVNLARLTFYPVRLVDGAWQLTRSVKVRVHFNAPVQASAQTPHTEPDEILALVRGAVENPKDVPAALPNLQPAPEPPQAGGARVFIEVNQVGITAITPQALTAAGFSLSGVNPANLRLWRGGTEVALEWEGDADATFEAGERFLFFAEPRFSRYTTSDVYILQVDTVAGLRLQTRGAGPGNLPLSQVWHTEVFEDNTIYTPDCYCGVLPAGRDGDRWVWSALTRPGTSSASFPFTLSYPPANATATLTLWLQGQTSLSANPDHRVAVSLNGTPLSSAVDWDGKTAYTATLTIPAGVLQTSNTLTLQLPGLAEVSIDGVWVDAFQVSYARSAAAGGNTALFANAANYAAPAAPSAPAASVANGSYFVYLPIITRSASRASQLNLSDTAGLRLYDVTQSQRPVRVSGLTVAGNTISYAEADTQARYFITAESGIRAPLAVRVPQALSTVKGKYIILTPSAFAPALTPLINLRQSQGLTVTVQTLQAVYDAWDGRPTPEAIKAYIQTAYDTWVPRPEYVLLVGDATSDPLKHRPDSSTSYLPVYLELVDPFGGETAADNRYVTMDGPTDRLPDLMLGRLPVNSLAEAQTVVNKIVSYETTPATGLWNATVTFVADDADSAGDFPAKAKAQANLLPTRYFTETLTVTGNGASTYAAVMNRWNSGAGVITFQGHSSIHQWAVERVMHLDDVSQLSNGLRLPVLLELTCFTGAFHTPNLPVLDESLLRHGAGGAVAVWGSTSLGLASGHDALSEGFLREAYVVPQPLGYVTLGVATQAGKLELTAQAPWAADLLDTFVLLGDPATRLTLPPELGNSLYLPLITR